MNNNNMDVRLRTKLLFKVYALYVTVLNRSRADKGATLNNVD